MVIIDGVAFTNSAQRGIQRYFYELLSRAVLHTEIAVFFDRRQEVPTPARCTKIIRREQFPTRKVYLPLWAWRQFAQKYWPTRIPPASVFHSTFFTRSPNKNLPEVVTVHDMVVERMPHQFGLDADAQFEAKRECIRHAAHIIAVSKSTADDLVSFYPEARDRISVIHHGSDHFVDVVPAGTVSASSPPYCLFVGDRFRYKNFHTLLAAMRLSSWPKEILLHVVGPSFSDTEKILIKHFGLDSSVVHRGYLGDKELAHEYKQAAVFVFPSLFEGLGLPILEAQLCGTPVVCSDIPVFHETTGGYAEFFEPLNPEGLVRALEAATETKRACELRQLGERNAKRFSWEDCANKTVAVWNSVASENL